VTALDGADEPATDTESATDVSGGVTTEPRPTRRSLRWWKEVLYAALFYLVYSFVRDTQGSASVAQEVGAGLCTNQACHHAKDVIAIERAFHLFHEEAIQHAFIGAHWFLRLADIYYGSAHFVITIVALIWLFRTNKQRYPLWRNTLAITTGLALLGFALFPLMPPRLLPEHYGFVDTLQRFGGSWSFDSGAMKSISNQYAAMPSLHFGWSSWCTCVLYPACRRWWTKALVVAYPFVTLLVIVITANHYILDAIGGATALAVAFAMSRALARFGTRRHAATTF
jgi:hypothetical protein